MTQPDTVGGNTKIEPPLVARGRSPVQLIKGPNIHSLPDFDPLPDRLSVPVLLKMGNDVSTDEILPAGAKVLPFRSNIQKIDDFTFERVDPSYLERARSVRRTTGHAVVAGVNYGQGSSREHAAIAPRNLGLRLVLAKGFARIHRQNLVNYGVLPLVFVRPEDYEQVHKGDILRLHGLHHAFERGNQIAVECGDRTIAVRHDLTTKQVAVILAGGLINWRRNLRAAS
jgi:aconitate hydratase